MVIRKIKTALRICHEQWRSEVRTPRTYMGYLIGISMVLMMSGNYLEYAAGRNVQLFEPFIVAITSPTYSIFIMM